MARPLPARRRQRRRARAARAAADERRRPRGHARRQLRQRRAATTGRCRARAGSRSRSTPRARAAHCRSTTARSASAARPRRRSSRYATLPSLLTATDVPTTAIDRSRRLQRAHDRGAVPHRDDGAGRARPELHDRAAEAGRRSPPARSSLELPPAQHARPRPAIWAVISDVDEGDTPHPLAVGRLNTRLPRSRRANAPAAIPRAATIVQPYGDYTNRRPALPGEERELRGRVLAGRQPLPHGTPDPARHRRRRGDLAPGHPGGQHDPLGGADGARLLFPVLPGSDLRAALP